MHNYIGWVKLPNGTSGRVGIQADNPMTAKAMLERQHGSSNVIAVTPTSDSTENIVSPLARSGGSLARYLGPQVILSIIIFLVVFLYNAVSRLF